MAKTRLQAERTDGIKAVCGGSVLVPGHEGRMKAHEERIHTTLGPMRDFTRNNKQMCNCSICQGYVKTKTVGPALERFLNEL